MPLTEEDMPASRWPIAANISLLFHELPLTQRPAAAAREGFSAVEMWWPFASAEPAGSEIDELVAAVEDAGIPLVALNFAAGNMGRGDRGLLNDPAKTAQLRASVEIAVLIGERTGCRLFNALYGNQLHGVGRAQQHDQAANNLAYAARAVRKVDGTVLVESLNAAENPRYLLPRPADAAQVVLTARASGRANVALLADVYHWAAAGDDPVGALGAYAPLLGHLQVADYPGRHEPGTGEVNFEAVYTELQRQGYRGAVAAEYRPTARTEDGLGWMRGPILHGLTAVNASSLREDQP
jgi:hydroxypyruvate isomerase